MAHPLFRLIFSCEHALTIYLGIFALVDVWCCVWLYLTSDVGVNFGLFVVLSLFLIALEALVFVASALCD